jgi:transcriptional regulator with XRE-family HTH domain
MVVSVRLDKYARLQYAEVTTMPRRSSPTLLRRELGARLRSLREEARLSAAQAANEADISASILSRLENGLPSRKPNVNTVKALCLLYGLDRDAMEDLAQLARLAGVRSRWSRYGLEELTEEYLELESSAESIENFEALVVPGLLQTERYAAAVIRSVRADYPIEKIQDHVTARFMRQQILTGESPAHLHAIIDEAVLYRMVGDKSTMQAQLERLLELAALPSVTIQILQFSAGANPGMDGTFAVLRFPQEKIRSAAYAEGQLGKIIQYEEDETQRCQEVFTILKKLAASSTQSISIIKRRISTMS